MHVYGIISLDDVFRGFGFDQEDAKETAHRIMDKAGDAVSKTTETMNAAASGDCRCIFSSFKFVYL